MVAFYADENVTDELVQALRGYGHDVLTSFDDGRANQGIDDPDVLARATQLGRVVVTNDRWDYHRLHEQGTPHDGIVTYTDDSDYPALAARIDAAVAPHLSLTGLLLKVIRPSRPQKP